jgi:signal transduction histidine kinase
MLAGVCGGIADRMGIDPTIVRIAFVVLVFVAGGGVAAYVAAWMFLPRQGEDQSVAARELHQPRELRIVLAVATAALAVVLGLEALGLPVVGNLAWPLLLGAAGLLVVWRGASADERAHLGGVLAALPVVGDDARTSRKTVVVRSLAGAVLVVGGLGGLASVGHRSASTVGALVGALAVIAGFLLLFGPWWLRMLRELTEERRERVRAEERADMAVHVHDSVLQTLALIQKAAGDPTEVTRLARGQERELRSWLFDGAAPGALEGDPTTVALAVASIEREVEGAHGTVVESVVVGDCPLDDRLRALMAAGREAVVNAAKWSGSPSVALYVEVEPSTVSMFVRDRGRGFDPAAVPADRKGIARSMRERMARNGGGLDLRSTAGAGTEVELVMPRQVYTS